MINRRHFSGTALSSVCLSLGLATAAKAEDRYPSKPVRIIFPGAPGGGVESLIRQIGNRLGERLGQPFVLENKPGANAQIGVNYVAKSPPDGYTLGVGFVTNLSLAPHTFRNLPYDPLKDLTPIGLLATNYLALVARPDAPFATVDAMSKWAKANSGGLSVGATSVGGLPHLAFEQLARMTTLPFVVVSYNGNTQLVQDLVGSRLDVAMMDYTGAAQLINTGKLKLIGISNPARDPRAPELATIGESVAGYQALGWFGFVAAAGTPNEIVETLNRALVAVIALPDVQETMATFGLVPAPGPAQDFAALLRSEDRRYAALVKAIAFKPQ